MIAYRGGWSGTGLSPNDAQFNSGQLLINTKIINDLETGGSEDVLSAEMGQAIVERLSIIPPEEQTINIKSDVVWLDGNNKLGSDGSVIEVSTSIIYKTSEFIDLPQGAKKNHL